MQVHNKKERTLPVLVCFLDAFAQLKAPAFHHSPIGLHPYMPCRVVWKLSQTAQISPHYAANWNPIPQVTCPTISKHITVSQCSDHSLCKCSEINTPCQNIIPDMLGLALKQLLCTWWGLHWHDASVLVIPMHLLHPLHFAPPVPSSNSHPESRYLYLSTEMLSGKHQTDDAFWWTSTLGCGFNSPTSC